MKALVVTKPGVVDVIEVASPPARAGEVVIEPRLVGMCGTDLELIDGSIDPAYVNYPLTLGHEWVGVAVDDVPGVVRAGDHVVVEGVVPCGVCDACRRGETNRCVIYDEIGFTRPGAAAQRIGVPGALVHRLEAAVEFDDAVFVEPMAVVWRALTRIPLPSGLEVAIVGDGTIALLAAHLVRLFDPSSIVVIGRREVQSSLAHAAGAHEFTTTQPEVKFDLVIEAAGTGPAVSSALALAARGAMVILLGLPAHGTKVEIAPDDLVNDDLVIQGSFSYTSTSWREVVERVNARELRPSFLISHRFALSEWRDAVAVLRGNVADDVSRGKVVVSISEPRRSHIRHRPTV